MDRGTHLYNSCVGDMKIQIFSIGELYCQCYYPTIHAGLLAVKGHDKITGIFLTYESMQLQINHNTRKMQYTRRDKL